MPSSPEVLIVGAGPAGIAAALRLARAGVSVMVLEGAEYAGAENWSGCVYHADGLLREDVLGRELWQQAPKERRIIARSLFVHDGINAAGFEARAHAGNDYGEAWTVLRPKLDRWLASQAIGFGATLLTATAVTGLRYRGNRVVGVNTDRGAVEAGVVFLAEGDAAGLLAREGLERYALPHYAQGIKAVFRLSPQEIERRFALEPGEGVAQEWLLRNGQLGGRPVRLNMTAFLYTNHDTLSLGLVLPLDRLAAGGVADHPHLFQRVREVAAIASYIKDAQQVSYGAKVIRSGGTDETPEWVRDGLAVGGGALGLGQEVPYPNFIAPAITSALVFADAVLRIRAKAADYTRDQLEREYAATLRNTTDFRNAELIRRWPSAIHGGPMLFEHLPAMLGQMIDAEQLPRSEALAQRRRALGVQLAHLRRDAAQALHLARGLGPRPRAHKAEPLQVRFLVVRGASAPQEIASHEDAVLRLAACAIGHFYGRRLPEFSDRVSMIWRSLGQAVLALPRFAGLGFNALLGGALLFGDFMAYKVQRIPLRELLLRPYHRYDDIVRRRLDWAQAHRTAASPNSWIATLDRYRPDPRHITVPLDLGAAGQQLRNVCPAEVYTVVGRLGGIASQHENCIKCESCRVTLPALDWNRSSGHRLAYRVPGDGRYGFDSSVESTLDLAPSAPLHLYDGERRSWQDLYRSLRARPAMVGAEWPRAWAKLLKEISVNELTRATHGRVSSWLTRCAYGWMETEVRALLEQAQAQVTDRCGVRESAEHERRRRAHTWEQLKTDFPPQRLDALAQTSWTETDRRALGRWIKAARADKPAGIEWLAEWSPALAWVAAGHYIAESWAGRAIDDVVAAPLWREEDGESNWLPACAGCHVDAHGVVRPAGAIIAHGAGADAAQPVRLRVESGLPGFSATPVMAELSVALAIGQASVLRRRALEYAGSRVQFRGEMLDYEGRDSIAKFGAVKRMLAGIEQAHALLVSARSWCGREPERVLSLVRQCMGPWMDAVPWLAGQIFGGMAYSEEDILARRYRDAILFSQWPGARELETEDPDFGARILAQALPDSATEYAKNVNLMQFTESQQRARRLHRAESVPMTRKPPRASRPLEWQAQKKFVYRSGGFLGGQLLSPDQLLTTEHYRRDPVLRSTRAEVLRLLRRGFRSPNRGEPYGRYIDSIHGMPETDVRLLRDFNAFATIVPETLGGKGWSKAQYSVLTNLCMGEKDTATGLLVMASTSIGTIPVLLGRDKDLPRLREEIGVCVADAHGWKALRTGLDQIITMLEHPEPKPFRKAMEQWGARIQRMFLFPGSTLKYLARNYLMLVQRTVETAKSRDLETLGTRLRQCRDGLDAVRALLLEEQQELNARERAHERFLQFLGCGQISAFALTEPAAGTDTGGIQTRAVLREVEAHAVEHGLYQFVPAGAKEPRLLLDGARLVFDLRRAYFRLPDGKLALLDDDGWDMARNIGHRRIRIDENLIPFDDIGTVHRRDGRVLYRYWELSGSKMWITNGSIADRYSLYAQTSLGETGFMLERRSEGLRIGPNENKLGQRASPTNELTLDRVRVSADQVIGFAGHGQVNALETLSVGRGGLVMSCAALAERVLQRFVAVWRKDPGLHAAAQAECDRLQTLAARLMGLMERADLQHGDFRVEAALSKYLASEGAHRILGWLEKLYGPMASAREAMLEKWRRDIRILNIYEGTNEAQRYLVLKDLPNLLRERAVQPVDNEPLEAALQAFRDFASARVAKLGDALWQNPDLQLRWFPVVDWMAELYSWSALHERARLLEGLGDPADRATLKRLRTTETSIAQHVQDFARLVRSDFEQEERGEGHPADASLALARAALASPAQDDAGPVAVGPLVGEWAVILRSRFEFGDRGLAWAGWNPSDLAVLDRLLDWSDVFPAMRVKVAVIAPHGLEDHLHRLKAAGADVLHLAQTAGATDVAGAALEIRRQWPQVRRWAFGHATGNARDQGFAVNIARLLAVELVEDVTALGSGARGLWVENSSWRRRFVSTQRRSGFAWNLKPSGRSGNFSVRSWLVALRARIPSAEAGAHCLPSAIRPLTVPAASGLPEHFAGPGELAAWLKQRFGASREPEPCATTQPARAPLAGRNLWIVPAESLARAGSSPALQAICDLDAEFGILAWHSADQAFPPVSRLLCQPRLAGLWQLPLQGEVHRSALAHVLAALVSAPQRIILGADQRAVGAALAARLGATLFDEVIAVTADTVTCSCEGFEAQFALPGAAVLIVGPAYGVRSLAETAGESIPLTGLPVARVRSTALARWQARCAVKDAGLATAKLIVDVGLGVATASVYKELVPPLCAALENLTGMSVELGATRKITQELKLLPASRQIGQTGIGVAPALLFALGISGAPQHMSWINPNALVIAVNRDPEAPIFSWQRHNPGPRVIACIGDLEEWIPELVKLLADVS
ncbi:MAG: acyl-CoA dehydrogenase family protein [Acidiferrobacterales bacterium]